MQLSDYVSDRYLQFVDTTERDQWTAERRSALVPGIRAKNAQTGLVSTLNPDLSTWDDVPDPSQDPVFSSLSESSIPRKVSGQIVSDYCPVSAEVSGFSILSAAGANTLALQSAIDAQIAKGGGKLTIREGVYQINDTIVIKGADGLEIDCAGCARVNSVGLTTGVVLVWDGPDGGTMLQLRQSTGAKIRGLTLDGNKTAGICFQAGKLAGDTYGAMHVSLEHCHFNNATICNFLQGSDNFSVADQGDSQGWILTKCSFQCTSDVGPSFAAVGLRCNNTFGFHFVECFVFGNWTTDPRDSHMSYGVRCQGGNYVWDGGVIAGCSTACFFNDMPFANGACVVGCEIANVKAETNCELLRVKTASGVTATAPVHLRNVVHNGVYSTNSIVWDCPGAFGLLTITGGAYDLGLQITDGSPLPHLVNTRFYSAYGSSWGPVDGANNPAPDRVTGTYDLTDGNPAHAVTKFARYNPDLTTDGGQYSTWRARPVIDPASALIGLAYSAQLGRTICVGPYVGVGHTYYQYSDDEGLTWTAGTVSGDVGGNGWHAACCAPVVGVDTFVVVSGAPAVGGGGTADRTMTSTDGKTLTVRATTGVADVPWFAIIPAKISGSLLFVAVGGAPSANAIMTSTTAAAASWTQRTCITAQFTSVSQGPTSGRLTAVGLASAGASLATSLDGVTWDASHSMPGVISWTGLAAGLDVNGVELWLACAYTGQVYISRDGVDFSAQVSVPGGQAWHHAHYHDGWFFVFGDTAVIMTRDGKNFFTRVTPITAAVSGACSIGTRIIGAANSMILADK